HQSRPGNVLVGIVPTVGTRHGSLLIFRMSAHKEVARRQSSPFTGKLSARPGVGKPGGYSNAKENLRRSLLRHFRCFKEPTILRRLSMRFLRQGEIYRSDVAKNQSQILERDRPPPAGRPRSQAKERVGRTTPF